MKNIQDGHRIGLMFFSPLVKKLNKIHFLSDDDVKTFNYRIFNISISILCISKYMSYYIQYMLTYFKIYFCKYIL